MRAIFVAGLAALAAALLPAAAAAQTDYFGIIGGYNMAQDLDGTDVEANGLGLGLVYGRELDSGLRLEGELNYRFADIETIGPTPYAGRATNLSLMFNMIYEIGLSRGYSYGGGGGGAILPYLGIGGGGALVRLEDLSTNVVTIDINDDSYAYAYQFIGGVGFEVTSDSIFSVDYRYIVTENADITDTGGTTLDTDFVDWTVTIGLRTRF